MKMVNANEKRAEQREVSKWLFGSLIAASFATTLALLGAGVETWHAHQAVRSLVAGTIFLVMELLVIAQPHRYRESAVMVLITLAGILLCLLGLELALWSYDATAGAIGVAAGVLALMTVSSAEVRKREESSQKWKERSLFERIKRRFAPRQILLKDEQPTPATTAGI